VLTAVSSPRAAGQVERLSAVVLDKIIASIPEESTWDKYLDQVKMSINNTISEAMGKTPMNYFLDSDPGQRQKQY